MPPAKKQKVPGTSPGKTPQPMTHRGDSVDWENGKKNHKRIGTLFLEHSQNSEWGQVWDDVPEAELCKQSFWGSFATYLVAIYRISLQAQRNPGKPLASASAAGVWSGLIEDTKNRFSESSLPQMKARTPRRTPRTRTPRTHARDVPMPFDLLLRSTRAQAFLKCKSGENCHQADWYKGIKTQIRMKLFYMSIENNESLDQSANCIGYQHILAVCEALARANTAEAAERKLAIKLLWREAGRGSEPGALSYGGLRWDPTFSTPTIESPQSKPGKLKWVALVAGVNRHADLLLDLGDHLVHDRGSTHFSTDEKCFILPSVGPTGGSSKISSWIKALQPKGRTGAADKYSHVAVESLPPAPTAGGVRPGAADMLAKSVPAEIAVHSTGHELTNLSALWEYLECRTALLIVGAIVLAGWPPLPYGQTGDGPKHPTLRALVEDGGGGVDMVRI